MTECICVRTHPCLGWSLCDIVCLCVFWTTIPVPSISLHKAPFQLPTQAHIIIHIHTHYWLPTHMYMNMCVL